MPGWHSGSYGYHGHEGFLFARKVTPTANSEQYATFSSGDVVGCSVNFDRSRIFFTKNGKLLLGTPDFESMNLRPFDSSSMDKAKPKHH